MENGKVMVKQLLVSFEPTYGEYKERIRDIEVWKTDINTHHCPMTTASDTKSYFIDGSFAMIIELFCDVNTSDKDVKIILDKCKKTFQEKINSKIEYWQKALNMLENKKAKFWIQDDKYGKQDIADWVHGCKCQNDGGFKPHELNQITEIIEKRKGEIVEKWESSLPDDSKLKQSNVAIMDRVYVESVRKDGFDLFINGKKIFVSFDKLPIFKDVQIQDMFNVNFFGEDALEWEDADIHIYIDTLIHPEKYTQRFPSKHIKK